MRRVRVLHFQLCYCQYFVEAIANSEHGTPRDKSELVGQREGHLKIEGAYHDLDETNEDDKFSNQQNFAEGSEEQPKIEGTPKFVNRNKVKVISYTWGQWGIKEEERVVNGKMKKNTDPPWRVIGHEKKPADSSQKISPEDIRGMCLGDEWARKDHNASFIKTLDRICNGTDGRDGPYYCWIDQLCGNQNKVEKILNMIPTIYRTLPVVAILPGAKCRCMVDYSKIAHEEFQIEDNLTRLNMEMELDSLNRHRSCFNILGCAQYFRRLWPRQELYYAHEIRAEWTSEDILTCPAVTVGHLHSRSLVGQVMSALGSGVKESVKHCSLEHFKIGLGLHSTLGLSSFRDLNVCVKLDWEHREDELLADRQKLANTLSRGVCSRWHGEALAASPSLFGNQVNGDNVCIICRDTERIRFHQYMLSKAMRTRTIAERAMADWFILSNRDRENAANSMQTLDKFLAGTTIKKAREPEMTNREKLSQFLTILGTLSSSFRDVTKPCDLVLAVWVDCPSYKIPENSKNMSLNELLDNALSQLQKNWGISPLASLPSGLFPSNSLEDMSPLAWAPSQYLSSKAEYKSTLVYAAVFEWAGNEKQIVVTSENPTKYAMEYPIPEGSRIMDLPNDGAYTREAHDSIVAAMSAWSHPTLVRLAEYAYPSYMAFYEENLSWPNNHSGPGLPPEDKTFLAQLVVPPLRDLSMSYAGLGLGLNKFILSALTSDSAFDVVDEKLALDIVFDVVCYIIGIDKDDAKRAELHLALDEGGDGQPPRLGLSRKRDADTRRQNFYLVPPNKSTWIRCRKVMLEVSTPHGASREPNAHANSTITGIWIQPKNKYAKGFGLSDEAQMGLVPLKEYQLDGGLLNKRYE